MTQRKIGIILSYGNIIIKNLVLFIYTPILLKYLGKSEYGLYQITNSVISNLSILNMGFSFAYIKFYTALSLNEKDKEKEIKMLNGIYLLIFSLISVISLLVGFVLVNQTDIIFSKSLASEEILLAKKLMVCMILSITLSFFNSVFDSSILAHEQFRFQQSRQLMQTIMLPVCTIPLLIYFNMGAMSIVLVQTFLSGYFLIVNAHFCIKKLQMKFTMRNLDLNLIKQIGTFSFFIFLNQIFNQVNENGPTFILGIFAHTSQVSIYSIANQLKNLFFMLSQSLSNVFIPKVNQIVHKSNDNDELTKLMTKIGQLQIIVLGFILGGFIVVGKYFLLLWVGDGYEMSYYLLISLVIPLLVPLIQNVGIEIQRAKNKHIFRSIVLTAFAVINVVITLFTVKIWGIEGSTIGYIISLIFGYGFVMNWYYKTKIGLDVVYFWKKIIPLLLPILLATALGLISAKYLPVNSVANFVICGVIYCLAYLGILYIILSKSKEDKELIQKIKWRKYEKKSH